MTTPSLNPIEPKTPRWEPAADPNDIVIPGLDTSAPPGDQIEQIEQLITIKLQNIDANFSKIQQIMANRILPAVKRYAVSTEPVREAAKFWTTFFEQAAQIRVPTYDDYAPAVEPSVSAESEGQDQTSTTEEPDATPSRHTFIPDGPSSEVSFMPGEAAVSSTPAGASRYGYGDEPTPSWSASLESPLIRLDREIQSLTRDDEISAASSSMADLSLNPDKSADITQRAPYQQHNILDSLSSANKSKGKAKDPQLLRQNVLLRNAVAADVSATPRSINTTTSPLKVKGKTPNLKGLNPYIPVNSKPADWKGVVDLKDPAVASPRRTHVPSRLYQPQPAKGSTTPGAGEDYSFDFGMSPPITMDFARLPKLGKTPRKEAAERIMNSILDVEKRGVFGLPKPGTETSMSTVPTPPSLSRYGHHAAEASSSVADSSLESLMRRVGDGFGGNNAKSVGFSSRASAPSLATAAPASSSSSLPQYDSRGQLSTRGVPIIQQAPERTPEPPVFSVFHSQDPELEAAHGSEGDMSSDSSFDEEANNTANPSAAFLFAAQGQVYDDDDDSFESNQSMDSLNEEDLDPDAPVHPLAHVIGGNAGDDEDGFDDDSFDDPVYQQEGEEETLFGVPPAQRQAQAQVQNLRMLGEDLLQDTMGYEARIGRVEESPTPWGGRGG
ncbi:hypothetical protein BXZ70DRAFT_896723 [Cristinia sonorae]|uniref:DASH complex subunit ASK1 n=1 Tax=Cristinia sonorae TaxID=1940300 RepID=A0A8K0UJI7_9AGAR|nr:hypothetical protein BXZ70DRAFT_896723 [Cristinia sonorae]